MPAGAGMTNYKAFPSLSLPRKRESCYTPSMTEPRTSESKVPETKGVTVKELGTVDLGPEIEDMAGRQMRMRKITFAPGATFGPEHDHKDRPGIVYILSGTMTDHRDGKATDYGPGLGWPEDSKTWHWLENRGPETAIEISVDIVHKE